MKLHEVIGKGEHLSDTPSIPQDDRDDIKKHSDDLEQKFNTLENDVGDEDKR
jgi:hypothetical protein